MTDFNDREVRAYGVHIERDPIVYENVIDAIRRAREEGISTDESTEED